MGIENSFSVLDFFSSRMGVEATAIFMGLLWGRFSVDRCFDFGGYFSGEFSL